MNQPPFSLVRSTGWLVPLAIVGGVVTGVLVAAAVVLANYEASFRGRIYPGVTAVGLDLSALTREEAAARLGARVAERLAQPVAIVYGDQYWRFTSAELGLQLAVEPLVEQALAIGREGWLPARVVRLWQLRQHGIDLGALHPQVDDDRLRSVVARLASEIDRPVVDAALTIDQDGEVRQIQAQSGRRLDREASLHRLAAALASGQDHVELVVEETPPSVRDEQVAQAAEFARAALASPLTLVHGERTWTLSRQGLRALLRLERRPDGTVEVSLDRGPLEELASRIAAEIDQPPSDARLLWADGRLDVLRPSQPGLSLEPVHAVEAMVAAIPSPDHRVELPVTITRPAVPMEERQTLGIKELIEHSSTSFAGSVPAKRHNIRLAAERINGVVVPPGKTFSFNEAVGPTTLEAGFRWGYGIENGPNGHRTVPSVAGGICQVATTLFQAVFWAGYTIEERYPHLYWIPSYTSRGLVGIDTTVDEAAGLDFRFTNSTPHHLLIQSSVEGDMLHFALYGTKPGWTVEVEGPIKTNIRPADPAPIVQEEPTLPAGQRVVVEAARDGFDVTLIRRVTQNGETRTLTLVSHYQPSRNVTLVGTMGRSASPTPTPQPTAGAIEAPATPLTPQPTAASGVP